MTELEEAACQACDRAITQLESEAKEMQEYACGYYRRAAEKTGIAAKLKAAVDAWRLKEFRYTSDRVFDGTCTLSTQQEQALRTAYQRSMNSSEGPQQS